MDHDATYSPEDNKLRIYPAYRLDKEDYYQLKSAGFIWAPKQELFVAPMWTPIREDIAIEFCGEIGDEDTSLVERAEERAERFDDYSDKRAADAQIAKQGVSAIADHIPFGQPILVGHHSEKRARKDAERIENGMRKAVKMWETSKYWEQRAKGAIRHAKYKERPDVRARRIKKIEAARRKSLKNIKEAKSTLNLWLSPVILSKPRALAITNYLSISYYRFPLDKYPRNPPISQYEGDMSLWGALDHGIINAKQARSLHVPALERGIAYNKRWLSHYDNRLLYEKAMLADQGASDLLKPKPRKKQLPICNYRAPKGITVQNPAYYAEKTTTYEQVEMTKAEYKKIYNSYRGVRPVENSHRIKICMRSCVPRLMEGLTGLERTNKGHSYVAVFLTDSKVHKRPQPVVKEPVMPELRTQAYTPPERTEFDDLKDTLHKGVKVVSAPQLFPTPKEVAEKMAEYLKASKGESVLEPSAGTGMLIGATGCQWRYSGGKMVAVELNQELCNRLEVEFPLTKVIQGDFLEQNGYLGKFDKIIMNPPFKNGDDIKHIKHAMTFLKPGGRLVALCANGPRQRDKLMPLADHWENLPQGTFKESGTMVNSALLVIEG